MTTIKASLWTIHMHPAPSDPFGLVGEMETNAQPPVIDEETELSPEQFNDVLAQTREYYRNLPDEELGLE